MAAAAPAATEEPVVVAATAVLMVPTVVGLVIVGIPAIEAATELMAPPVVLACSEPLEALVLAG